MNQQLIPSDDLQGLNKLHRALTLGVTFVIGIFYFLKRDELVLNTNSIFFYLGFGLVMIGIIFSEWFYKNNLKNHSKWDYPDFDKAFNDSRAASIRRWAFIEGPTLTCAVLMFLDSNMYLLFVALIGLFFLLYSKLNMTDFEQNYKFPKTNS